MKFFLLVIICVIFVTCSKKDQPDNIKKTYSLDIESLPIEGGDFSKVEQEYEEGTKITLIAKPNNGYFFERWTGDILSFKDSINFVMDEDKVLVANFIKSKIYIEENTGTVKCTEEAEVGYKEVVNGVEYIIVDEMLLAERIKNNVNISNVCTTKVTTMSWLFSDVVAFNGDISKWDVSNVKSMEAMFRNATGFNADLSKWDVGNVTDMSLMFANATSFKGDLSNWDVSNVSLMIGMFVNAESFDANISNWDVSSVTYMSSMFQNAINFNQDLSKWNVTKVNNCGLFSYNTKNWKLPKPNLTCFQ